MVIVLLGVIALGVVGNIITKFSPIRDAHASDIQKIAICDPESGMCASVGTISYSVYKHLFVTGDMDVNRK